RVGEASDNAAYWSIATTMRSDNMALSAVQDALGLGAAKVDTAYSAMETAVEVVKEIKAKLVAATEEGVDRSKIQEEIEQLQQQLRTVASAASFSGENWLQADVTTPATVVTKNVVGSFVRSDDGSVSVKKINYDLGTDTVLFDTSGNKNGILDRIFNVSQNAVTLTVNTSGVGAEYTVAAYTIDQLIAAGATFTTNTVGTATTQLAEATADLIVGGVTVITTGDYFVQVNANTWALASDVTGTGQEALHYDGVGIYYGVDTSNGPAINIPAPESIDTVDITLLTNDELDVMVSAVDKALEAVISTTADLGSLAMRIEMQENFVASLTDSIDSGIGRLVDADMNEESTRLKALQTQQQLAIQSLSIANTSSENILQLFRQ
ncbi:MAG TPA: flagellin, partial [Mycoplana sp.]|nr:flagellin [Mycoplana sp.]